MPTIDSRQFYEEVEKSLHEQKFSPIYLLHGDEPYLIQQALNYLKVCALHGGAADFNFTSYYAADAEISRVRDEVETLPMMSSRRVVVLREIQDLTDKEWSELESLIEAPVETSVFILVGSKLDKRKKVLKTLLDTAVSLELKKPYENQIPGWIRQIAKVHHLTMTDEAIQLLHRLAGNHLMEIEAEIKKLSDYLGERKEAELEDVSQCVSKKREESVFEFANSIAKADQAQALVQLAGLLDQGQNEIGIVSMVARHVRILLLIRQGIEMELGGQKLAAHAQVPTYFLSDYVQQGRQWTTKKLESALLILAETDKALKSSPLSAPIWLENMVFRTCHLHSPSVQSMHPH